MNQPKPIRYTIDGDARGFRAATKRAAADLGSLGRKARATDRALDMTANVDVDDSALGRLRARMLEQRAALERDIETNVDIDAGKALAELRAIERRIRSIDRMRADVDVDVDTKGGVGRGVVKGLAGLADIVQDGVGDAIQQAVKTASSNQYVGAVIGAGIVAAAATATPVIIAGVGATVGAAVSKGMFDAGVGLLEGYDAIQKANRKAEVVFGDNLDVVEDWARGLAAQTGLGSKEMTTIAAGVTDILVPKGFNRGTAVDITKIIAERGAALADWAPDKFASAEDAINAVTSAGLGQTRQLKSAGVEINQSLIKQQVALMKTRGYFSDYGEDSVQSSDDVRHSIAGMTDEQLKFLAAVELTQLRSADAMDSFIQGTGSADDFLDALQGTLKNLKTDAIEGFGRIFVGVLDDIRANLNLDFPEGGLKQWIADNESSIRTFFLNVMSAGVSAAIGTLQFAKALTSLVGPALMAGKAALLFAKYLLDIASIVTLPMQLVSGTVRDFFSNTKAGLDNALGSLDSFSGAWGTLGPAIQGGLDTGITALTGLQGAVDATKSGLTGLDGTNVSIGVDTSNFMLGADPHRLMQVAGAGDGITVPVKADTASVTGALASIPPSKPVQVQAQPSGFAEVNQQLASWERQRTTHLQVMTSGFAEVNEQLASWERQRTTHLQVMTSGFAAVNEQLASWERTRHTYLVVHRITGGGGDEEEEEWQTLFRPGPVVSRDAYIGTLAAPTPTAARYGSTTTSGRDQGDHHLPGSGRTRHVEPAARPATTQVNVYLDGRQIAAQLQPPTRNRRA